MKEEGKGAPPNHALLLLEGNEGKFCSLCLCAMHLHQSFSNLEGIIFLQMTKQFLAGWGSWSNMEKQIKKQRQNRDLGRSDFRPQVLIHQANSQ